MSLSKIDIGVVLIADVEDDRREVSLSRTDLEFADSEYLQQVHDALGRVCRRCIHYENPRDFLDNIAQHKSDLVFSIWSGQGSRNRKALISSICEAYGVRYVGADTYTQIICQDKYLSKLFCDRHGLRTSPGHLIESKDQYELIDLLHPPLVVKPNFEGGSIGISQRNLVQSSGDAKRMCSELLSIFKQPILVEEFVDGREVSLVMVGNTSTLVLLEAVELTLEGVELQSTIFSYELKKAEPHRSMKHKLITSEIPPGTIDGARKLFVSLDKVEVIRVDGRLRGSELTIIELSPDVHFGAGCTVADAFELAGIDYEGMLRTVVLNSLHDRGCQSQNASMR